MKRRLFTLAAAAIVLAACSPASPPAPEREPVVPETEPVPNELGASADMDVDMNTLPEEPLETAESVMAAVIADPQLSIFLAALQAADLEETLTAGGPYTVFAPTNEAFDALPAGYLDILLLPESEADLSRIVEYHVLPDAVMAAEAPTEADGTAMSTLNGLDIAVFQIEDGAVMVNQATVTAPDIEAVNGVVHKIDTVLVPRMSE